MTVIIIGFVIAIVGLVLKIVGVCIRNEQVCAVGEWFDSAAGGYLVGIGIMALAGNVKLYTPAQIQTIIDKSNCWTIDDGQKRCGEDFTYENEKIKVEKKGHDTNIYLK